MQDTACIRERQIQVMNRALDFLTNSGTVLSLSIRNQISVVMTDYDFFGLHLPLPFFDTTEVISPRQRLSAPLEYQKISFMESNDPKFSQKLQIPITHTGTINSIMIETITEIAPGISCGGSDWFNAPYVVPLQKSLQVTKGDCISLTLSYIMGEGLKSFSFSNVVHN
jgi:predicted RNA methylase